jgi:hypothetical protein
MKLNKSLLSGFTLLFALATAPGIPCRAAELQKEALSVATPSFSIFLIDDQTGEELSVQHGIRPLATGDLEVLINAVLKGVTPVRLFHQAVDEDAADNPVGQMDFRPYSVGRPPTPPSPNLPIRQLGEEMKRYRADRAAWQQGIMAYRNRLVADVESFVRQVMSIQGVVARRFDQILAARNGRDFNRSDIVGSVVAGNAALGTHDRRILVLNTDAKDLPGKRHARNTPLTPQELSPDVELVWVNTSRIPDQSVLFRGLPNPTHHVSTMREAMELIVGLIGAGEKTTASDSTTADVTDDQRTVTLNNE